MKLICVDDDPAILAVLKVSLETVGDHNVETALNAQAAIDSYVAPETDVDCFLLDIQMPGMTGVELCEIIRARPKYRDTPILMLTAMSDDEYIEDAFLAGATDYIAKPFDPTDLNARVGSSVARMKAQAAQRVETAPAKVAEPSATPAPVATQPPAKAVPPAVTAQLAGKSQAKPAVKAQADNTRPVSPASLATQEFFAQLKGVKPTGTPQRTQQEPSKPAAPKTPDFAAIKREVLQKKDPSRSTAKSAPEVNALNTSAPIVRYSNYEPSISAIAQEVPEPQNQGMSERFTLTGSKRILGHATFETYLETMSSNSKKQVNIFSLGVVNVASLYEEFSEPQFRFLINETALIIADLLKPHRSLFSYFGDGIFCGTIRDEGINYVSRFPEMFEQAVHELNHGANLFAEKDVTLVVGDIKAPSMFNSPVGRLQKAVLELSDTLA